MCRFACRSVCRFVYRFVCRFVCRAVCRFVCRSVCRFVRNHVSRRLSIPRFRALLKLQGLALNLKRQEEGEPNKGSPPKNQRKGSPTKKNQSLLSCARPNSISCPSAGPNCQETLEFRGVGLPSGDAAVARGSNGGRGGKEGGRGKAGGDFLHSCPLPTDNGSSTSPGVSERERDPHASDTYVCGNQPSRPAHPRTHTPTHPHTTSCPLDTHLPLPAARVYSRLPKT